MGTGTRSISELLFNPEPHVMMDAEKRISECRTIKDLDAFGAWLKSQLQSADENGESWLDWKVQKLREACMEQATRISEAYNERAAIMEFDGGLPRHEAEAQAALDFF